MYIEKSINAYKDTAVLFAKKLFDSHVIALQNGLVLRFLQFSLVIIL